MDLAELVARESIRATIARYNNAGDRGRVAELCQCFASDGVLEIDAEGPVRGREAIEARLSQVVAESGQRSAAPLVRHHVSNTHIEFEGPDRARAFSYFFVITEVGPDHWGRYVDQLQRVGEAWLFAWRRVVTEGASEHASMGRRHRRAPEPR